MGIELTAEELNEFSEEETVLLMTLRNKVDTNGSNARTRGESARPRQE